MKRPPALRRPKPAVLATAGLVALLALAPLPAQAIDLGVGNVLLDAFTWLLQHTLVPLADWFLSIAASLFDFVMSPEFNQIPLTHGLLVNSGWTIMRDFANMLFIAMMVIMAFGTMLGAEQYGWRKMLPRLIGVALLINFTKFFAGLIVDFANIIILFFIQNGIQGATDPTHGIGTVLANAMGLAKLFSSNEFLTNVLGLSSAQATSDSFVAAILQMVFLWAAGITLILLAITLIIRIIRIWMLVIFSPLALMAFLLPSTKHFGDQWIKELVHWSFMGVSITFFVYMAALLTQAIFTQGDLGAYIDAVTGKSTDLSFLKSSNFVGEGAPILIFFLIVGLLNQARKLGMQASDQAGAIAVGAITGARQRLQKGALATGRYAGRETARSVATSKFGQQRLRPALMRAEAIPVLGGAFSGITARFEKFQKEAGQNIDTDKKRLEDVAKKNRAEAYNTAQAMLTSRDSEKRVAAGLYLHDSGELKDEEFKKISGDIEKFGRIKEFPNKIPLRIPVAAQLDENAGQDVINATTDTLRELSKQMRSDLKDATKLQPESLSNNKMVVAALIQNQKAFEQILSRGSPELVDALQTGFDKLAKANKAERAAVIQFFGLGEPGTEEAEKAFNERLIKPGRQRFQNPFHAARRGGFDEKEAEKETGGTAPEGGAKK